MCVWEHILEKVWRKNRNGCLAVLSREEGRRSFPASAIPFTSSSLLFLPHAGLPRSAAGLLTLCSAWQTSAAAGRRDSGPESLLRLPAFLRWVSRRCQRGASELRRRFLRVGKTRLIELSNLCLSWTWQRPQQPGRRGDGQQRRRVIYAAGVSDGLSHACGGSFLMDLFCDALL